MAKTKNKKSRLLPVSEPTKEELDLFNFKNDYLLNNPFFDFKEVKLEDFLDKMFIRPTDKGRWPFEAEQCEAYKIWRKQYENQLQVWEANGGDPENFECKNIDYSQVPEFRSNPIALYFLPKTERGTGNEIWEDGRLACVPKQRLLLKEQDDDGSISWDSIEFLRNAYFAIVSPVTFIGKNRTLQNAKWCYGIGVDLDYVGKNETETTLYYMTTIKLGKYNKFKEVHRLPIANMITNSGHGLHLYFLLETPIDIHLDAQRKLIEKLKYGLIEACWLLGKTSATLKPADIQWQGIIQGFRVPESLTKFKTVIRSFYNENSHYYTLRELNSFVKEGRFKLTEEQLTSLESGIPYDPNRITLAEAKRRWPEWYHERIELGMKPKTWTSKRHLYDYWVNLIEDLHTPITVGHRYFCLKFIAVLGRKCDIPKEAVKDTIMRQVEHMESLTPEGDNNNHFLEADAKAALEAYDDEKSMRISWKHILSRSGLAAYISELNRQNPKHTIRKGRDQETHLKRARALRDLDYPNGKWINKDGRPKADYINSKDAWKVAAWRYNNPLSTNKSACAKDTGLSRPTVRKWWGGVDELFRLTGGGHVHWRYGATPEGVGALFRDCLIADQELTDSSDDIGLEIAYNLNAENDTWNDPYTDSTFDEDILRSAENVPKD